MCHCGSACQCNTEQYKLNTPFRKVWTDHILYTREYILYELYSLPHKADIVARVMKNQEEIGAVFATYYGAEVGSQLTTLLKNHEEQGSNIVTSVKYGAPVDQLQLDWFDNADLIVKLLVTINPYLHKSEMTEIFYKHLDQVNKLVEETFKRRNTVPDFDMAIQHMLNLANVLTFAISRQFNL